MSELDQPLKNKVFPATWTASPRWIALDYDAGSDANVGFSDVSSAAAGLVAKKTWEGVEAILPAVGNGRRVDILIKPRAAGATYKKQDGTTDAQLNLSIFNAYQRLSVRATDTDTTASSVAFAGDTNDEIYCGARRANTTNTAGYRITKAETTIISATSAKPVVVTHDGVLTFVTGERVMMSQGSDTESNDSYLQKYDGWIITVVDSTHFSLDNSDGRGVVSMIPSNSVLERYKLVKADGTPAALPSDTTMRMWRLRGDIANTTVATRNQTFTIIANSTDCLILGRETHITAVNGTTDFWYIEEPNAVFGSLLVEGASSHRIAGIRCVTGGSGNAQINANPKDVSLTFCTFAAPLTVSNCGTYGTSPSWLNNAGTTRQIGGGVKAATGCTIAGVTSVNCTSMMSSGSLVATRCLGVAVTSSLFAGNLTLTNCGTGVLNTSSGTVTLTRVRMVGNARIIALGSSGTGLIISFEGTAQGCMEISGDNATWQFFGLHDGRTIASDSVARYGISVAGSDAKVLWQGRTIYLRGNVNFSGNGSDREEVSLGDWGIGLLVRNTYQADYKGSDGLHIGLYEFHAIQSTTGILFSNDETAAIPRARLVHVTSITPFTSGVPPIRNVAAVLADSVANVEGELHVANSASFLTGGGVGSGNFIIGHGSGYVWVESDELCVEGDILYVSPTTPGRVTKVSPVVSGTNQKRRVGTCVEPIVHDGLNFALFVLRPEMLPVPADGLE